MRQDDVKSSRFPNKPYPFAHQKQKKYNLMLGLPDASEWSSTDLSFVKFRYGAACTGLYNEN